MAAFVCIRLCSQLPLPLQKTTQSLGLQREDNLESFYKSGEVGRYEAGPVQLRVAPFFPDKVWHLEGYKTVMFVSIWLEKRRQSACHSRQWPGAVTCVTADGGGSRGNEIRGERWDEGGGGVRLCS